MNTSARMRRYFRAANCAVRATIEPLESRVLLSTVAYWRFENGSAGSPVTGPVLDELGLNSLTVQGAPTYNSESAFRVVPQTLATNFRSARFNGNALVSSNLALNNFNNQQWTIEATVKLNSAGQFTFIGKDGPGGTAADLWFQTDTTQGGKFVFYMNDIAGQSASVIGKTAPVVNQWYHVAASSDGTTLRLYVDGQLEGSQGVTKGGAIRSTAWTVGRGYFNGGPADYINGSVDEVRFSDTALSPNQFLTGAPTSNTTVSVNLGTYPETGATVPSNAVVSSEWRSQGILFSARDGQGTRAIQPIVYGSGAGPAGRGIFFTPDYFGAVAVFDFVRPGTTTPTDASYFRINIGFDSTAESVSVVGLDESGNVVARVDKTGINGGFDAEISGKFRKVEVRTSGNPGIGLGTPVYRPYRQTYASGFVWSRFNDYQQGVTSQSASSNPNTDQVGNPAWYYGWTDQGNATAQTPWYALNPTSMVWQTNWFGDSSAGNLRWARAQSVSPIIGQTYLLQANVFDSQQNYIPIVTWNNPTGRSISVDILGPASVTWGFAASPGRVEVVVAKRAVNTGIVTPLYDQTFNKPTANTSSESVNFNLNLQDVALGPNDQLIYGVRKVDDLAFDENILLGDNSVRIVDDTPAATVSIDLQAASDTGVSSSDNITNDTTPTFDVLTNVPGRIDVDFNGDGTIDATQTVAAAGAYSFTPATVLVDGTYTARVALVPVSAPSVSGSLPFTIDTIGPTLVLGGGTAQAPYASRGIQFNEPIDPSSITAADAVLVQPNGTVLGNVSSVTGSGQTYTATFSPTGTAGNWTLRVGPQVTDIAGNLMAAAGNDVFGVLTDTTAPQVIAQNPIGVVGTNISSVRVKFSEWINASSLAGNVSILTPSGTIAPGSITVTPASIIADSVNEFSGVQGQGNWSYGYYNRSTDSNSQYEVNDFVAFAPTVWRGQDWQLSLTHPPYTIINSTGTHPNGSNNGQEHWTVRRYVSDVSGNVTLTGALAKTDVAGGTGVTGHIFVDGVEVYTHTISGTDGTGVQYSVSASLHIGSTVDFVLDPNGNDFNDGTRFTSQIRSASAPPGFAQAFDISFPTQSADGDYFVLIGSGLRDFAGNALVPPYQGTFTIDQSGPRVVSSNPSGAVSQPFSQIDLTFSEPIDATTFTPGEVSFLAPGGAANPVTGVSRISATVYRISFAQQPTAGTYSLTVGPNITDRFGNLMDQDTDGIKGEPVDDQYRSQINLALANLTVDSVSTSPAGTFGAVLPVSYTVRNNGLGSATGSWNDKIYLSADDTLGGDDLLLSTVDVGTDSLLSINGTYTKNINVTLPLNATVTAGSYRIIVVSDAANALTEVSETDNNGTSATLNVSLPPIPDLTVSSVSVPLNAFAGERINLTWTITNTGTGPATGTWVDRAYLSADQTVGNDALTADFSLSGTINAGQSITRQQSIQLPLNLTGTFYTILTTDINDQIFEHTNENNNTRVGMGQIAIGTARVPNLQVTPGSVVTPGTATAGQQKTITWTVRNVGTAATNTPVWQDAVYLSTDQTLDGSDRRLGSVDNANFLNPNESYNNSLIVTIPVDVVGDYYFIIKTDDGNQVFENDSEGDNATAAATRTTIAPAITADLQMVNVSAPLAAGTGESITLNWAVRNVGPVAPPNSWQDFVYLSSDNTLDASDTFLGYKFSSQILGPGDSYQASATYTLPSNLMPGNYYLFVWANPSATNHGSNFYEQNTANNIGFNAIPTHVTLVAPDLQLQGVSAPASATSGQPMNVTYIVKNFGNSTTAGWTDSIYLSTDTTLNTTSDIFIGFRNHYGLAQDQSYTDTVPLTIPNGLQGTYYVFASTDSGHSLFELDETNNVSFASAPVVVSFNPPDLVVSSSSLTGSTAQAGGSLLLNWIVKNQGGGSTLSNWSDSIVLSSDNIFGNADDRTLRTVGGSLLGPNQSYDRSNQYAEIPFSTAPGNYYVFVVADTYNQVLEGSAESNNASAAMPLTITRQIPDLQATSVTAPTTVASGSGLTVNWTVKNLGAFQTNTSNWNDAVYLSTDPTLSGDDFLLGTQFHSGTLGVNGQYDVTATYTVPIDVQGTYYVIVQTDRDKAVVEDTFENNNTRIGANPTAVTLTKTPDLTLGIITPPATAYAGQNFSLTYTVNNLGGAINSGTWYDAVYLSADQVFDRNSDTYVGSLQNNAPLAANSSYTRTLGFTIPQGFGGIFYVFVETDTGNRVYERTAENNNIGYAPSPMNVTIPPPADLTIGTITIPSNSAPGQIVSITYTVNNQGTSAALGSWQDSVYISADDKWDLGDAFFTRVTHKGDVPAGGNYTVTATAPLPGVLPGDYKVIVRSDIRNAVPESNKANNIGASLNNFNISPQLLTLGAATSNSLGQGNSAYYRVNVPAGETLLVNFDSNSATASNELYVRFGQMPTRSVFDYAFTNPFSPDQKVVVPSSQGGTYYILAYGDKVSGSPSFTLTASTPQFGILDTDYGTAGDQGRITLKINGAKLTARTTATLKLGGTTVNALDTWLGDSATLYATFDLRGAPLGRYDVTIADPAVGSSTVPTSLNVVHGRGAHVDAFFNGAPNVVLGRTYPLQLRYGNTGDSDGLAPLITITGAAGIPFGLSPTDMRVDRTIQFLGINSTGPAGIFRPGDESGTQLFFRTAIDPTKINLTVITADDPTPIDWASLKNTLKPDSINTDAWDAVFSVLTTPLKTWGDFVVMLNDNASYLSQLGQRISDLGTLWTFEVQQAIGNLTPLSAIASAVDASMPAPGLALELDRSFGNTVVSRYGQGIFGRGWETLWDTYAVTNTDGSVSIFDPTGIRRKFTPNSNSGFDGSAGDAGALSTVGGGYLIRETSGYVTSFRPDGKIGYIEDTNGNRITATWTNGRLTRIDHRSGQSLLLTYNAAGRVATVTDSANRITTYTYDANNQHLLTVTAPDGKVTSYTYVTGQGIASEHALASVTSGGVTRTFTYQPDGKLDKAYLANNQELIDFNYDSAAEVMVLDGASGETDFFYDQRQLLTRVDDALGNTTTAVYGDDLRISQLVDPLGQTRSFTWCSCGMPTSITDEAGNKTTFDPEYIAGQNFKRVASFTDANNHKTSYSYDSHGNLLTTVYADGSVESLGNYDQFGNARLYTNRRSQPLSYTYNAAGQVLRQTFADNTHTEFTYDTRGNLLTVTDATGIATYTYDYATTGDRLRRVTYPNGRYLDYTYDSVGRRSKMVDQTGFTTQDDYDAAGRLWHVRDGSGTALATYAYDAAGRLSRIDKGNGTYTTYQYDADGQILHLLNFALGGTVSTRFDYTYDKLGRRKSMATIDGTWTYTYDKTSQLTHAVFASANVAIANQDLQYVYDAVGNRIRTFLNGVTTEYTTNNVNEYTSVGGQAYQYDADGNLKFDGVNAYAYDQSNHLISVTGPSGVTQYEYDGLGDRVATIQNGQRTEYLLDLMGMVEVAAEFDGAGIVQAHNVFGLGLLARSTDGSLSSYFDFDGLGSVVSLMSNIGSVLNTYVYDPFGRTLLANQVMPNAFQFIGAFGVQHEAADMDFMRARYYSSVVGRFNQIDPLRLGGRDQNFYRYSLNSPSNLIDAVGLASFNAGGSFFSPSTLGGGGAVSLSDDGGGCVSVFVGVGTPGGGLSAGGSGSLGSEGSGFSWNAVDVSVGFGPISVDFSAGTDGISGGVSFSNPGGGIGASVTTGGTYCWPPPPPLPPIIPPQPPQPPNHPPYNPPTQVVHDPNDIIGPHGFSDDHWVSGHQRLGYTIEFENDPILATAPVHVLHITQALDSDFDPRTFRVGDFGFGSIVIHVPEGRSFYTTRLDLTATLGIYVDFAAGIDVSTGEAFWDLTSIDPATGDVPLDPSKGFLPPNTDGISGQGYVQYSVRPKTSATTGTRVDAMARIVFDINAPMDTPTIFNTLDADNPTSNVAALPASTTNKNFLVSWSGGDPSNGSALANYTIYVSDNGGAFAPWLTDTTLTQATYAGTAGHTYAFYSLAKDNAGNVEDAPMTADAQITVQAVVANLVGRSIFYNNSAFDGNNTAANPTDDGAIATDKHALLPGQTATFANYTSYSKGINGIMVDISNLANGQALSASDFMFKVGNDSNLAGWADAPAPISIMVRPGAGANGSDRVEIIWADNVIQRQWLQITVKATANTGLATADVFYFGNAIGESGNSATDAAVTAADVLAARGRISATPVANDNPWDYNRDGVISSADMQAAQQHLTAGAFVLTLLAAPATALPAVTLEPAAAPAMPAPNTFQSLLSSLQIVPAGTATASLSPASTNETPAPALAPVALAHLPSPKAPDPLIPVVQAPLVPPAPAATPGLPPPLNIPLLSPVPAPVATQMPTQVAQLPKKGAVANVLVKKPVTKGLANASIKKAARPVKANTAPSASASLLSKLSKLPKTAISLLRR